MGVHFGKAPDWLLDYSAGELHAVKGVVCRLSAHDPRSTNKTGCGTNRFLLCNHKTLNLSKIQKTLSFSIECLMRIVFYFVYRLKAKSIYSLIVVYALGKS